MFRNFPKLISVSIFILPNIFVHNDLMDGWRVNVARNNPYMYLLCKGTLTLGKWESVDE